MYEMWKTIEGFPLYEVSNYGNIRYKATGRFLRLYENKDGVVHVGLMKNRLQRRRSVAKLVAVAFVPQLFPAFDTPICLNGDRWDIHAANLRWRPRWFARQYNKQFRFRSSDVIDRPIRNITNGRIFTDSWDCAVKEGLLEKDLVLSILNHTYAWPSYDRFEVIL